MLETAALFPRGDRVLHVATWVFALSPIAFAVDLQSLAKPAAYSYVGGAMLILLTGLAGAWKRQRSAYFFLAAFAVLALAAMVMVLSVLGTIPSGALTANAVQLGSALEMILLALALADRMNRLRKERAQAMREAFQAQQNVVEMLRSSERVLEAAVAQRTLALDQKNVALQKALVTLEDVERIARHDLKTPLASVAAAPAMLRALRPASAREETILGMIENAAHHALSLVNLSLDLYRMETGTYQLHPVAVDLSALVNTVAQHLGVHAASKTVVIAVTGAEQPTWAVGEVSLCYSIIANIAKNAIEAAPDHSTVQITLHASPEVRLVMHNSGAVPQDMRDRFFEKYASSGKAQGTGLGTYSSHLLSRVQGGSLTMETSDTLGTTLTLTLRSSAAPLQRDVPQPGLPPSNERAEALARQSLQVLLVDDDDFSRLVMESHLARPQLVIETAVNGRLAVDAVMRQRPDIIFLDIEMPVMNGSAALVKIRAYQASAQQVPSLIVAVSGHDDLTAQAHYLDIGFNHVLTKPCSREAIDDLVQSATA